MRETVDFAVLKLGYLLETPGYPTLLVSVLQCRSSENVFGADNQQGRLGIAGNPQRLYAGCLSLTSQVKI